MKPTLDWNFVNDLIVAFGKWQDEWLDKRVAVEDAELSRRGQPIRCSKGCGTCCRVYVEIGGPDALRIALHLRNGGRDTPELRADLLARGRVMEESAKNAADHGKKHIPCVFLHKQGYCTIYRVRPTVCRFFRVVSDPALCETDALETDLCKVQRVMFLKHRDDQLERLKEFSAATWTPLCGALPFMVLWALKELEARCPTNSLS